jgi:hypothetical protein
VELVLRALSLRDWRFNVGGSSGGGPIGIPDVKALIAKAKESLQGKRNVFISFAMEDQNEVNLLRGQAKNENSLIEFNDWSVSEPYNSDQEAYIESKITERINSSSVTVVFYSNNSAKSRWVEWEVNKSKELGKHVIGVYPGTTKPSVHFPVMNDIECVAWSQLSQKIAELQ